MRTKISLVMLLLSCLVTSAQSPDENQVNLLLSTLPPNQDLQRYKNYVPPQFKGTVHRSFYLTMRDGVRIAVQLVLPGDLPPDQKIPAILNMTRYWRARQGEDPMTKELLFAHRRKACRQL